MTKDEINEHNKRWYEKTYYQFIEKCRSMKDSGELEGVYTETHHILPRCKGGTNDFENLVDLPARYHIIAHLLLIKIYPGDNSLVYAAHMMLHATNNGLRCKAQSKISTRTYSEVRELYSKSMKGRLLSSETKQKMSISRTGSSRTEEQKKKHTSEIKTGKNHNFYGKSHREETKRLMSASQTGEKNHFYGKSHSKESLRRIQFTKTHSVEAPDGAKYKNLKDAAKAAVMSTDKLSNWLYSEDTHGYKWIDKIK